MVDKERNPQLVQAVEGTSINLEQATQRYTRAGAAEFAYKLVERFSVKARRLFPENGKMEAMLAKFGVSSGFLTEALNQLKESSTGVNITLDEGALFLKLRGLSDSENELIELFTELGSRFEKMINVLSAAQSAGEGTKSVDPNQIHHNSSLFQSLIAGIKNELPGIKNWFAENMDTRFVAEVAETSPDQSTRFEHGESSIVTIFSGLIERCKNLFSLVKDGTLHGPSTENIMFEIRQSFAALEEKVPGIQAKFEKHLSALTEGVTQKGLGSLINQIAELPAQMEVVLESANVAITEKMSVLDFSGLDKLHVGQSRVRSYLATFKTQVAMFKDVALNTPGKNTETLTSQNFADIRGRVFGALVERFKSETVSGLSVKFRNYIRGGGQDILRQLKISGEERSVQIWVNQFLVGAEEAWKNSGGQEIMKQVLGEEFSGKIPTWNDIKEQFANYLKDNWDSLKNFIAFQAQNENSHVSFA